MPRRSLLLVAFLGAAPLAAQGAPAAPSAPVDSATLRTARTLMEVTKAADNFVAAFEQALAAAPGEGDQKLPPLFLDRFKTAVRAELPKLLEEMALIHARAYTKEEMEGFIRFFRTPLGQTYVAKQAGIGIQSGQMGQRWGASLAMRVMSEMIQNGEMEAPQ